MNNKKIIAVITLSMIVTGLYASTIKVNFKNLKNKDSILYVGLYNDKAEFPDFDKAYRGKEIQTNGEKEAEVVFKGVPQGTYAIASFQDVNNNSKLDKNWIGLPSETYGFSGNNTFPNYEKSAFKVEKNETKNIDINL